MPNDPSGCINETAPLDAAPAVPFWRCNAKLGLVILVVAMAFMVSEPASARDQWTKDQATRWYAAQPWLIGSNYVPASAINQLEMWQSATWNPQQIDKEFAWAQALHMNTMRVFLQDQLWSEDPTGFERRIDEFLTIAHRHGIRPMFVLFDSCWDPAPKLGPQHPPVAGVHNSGWVQSPGMAELRDASSYPRLRAYVQGVVGRFANDDRILAWDLWNEPDNPSRAYRGQEGKEALVANLLPQVFEWARAANPSQPLTSGVWDIEDKAANSPSAIVRTQLTQSDVLSFHDYSWPEDFLASVRSLASYGRPILCTEFMARNAGSTFEGDLPIAKKYNIAMYNWGFVDGKTQTRLPWDSWIRPYTPPLSTVPHVWQHDLLKSDGTPYRQAEVDLIQRMASTPKGQVPPERWSGE